MVDQRTKSVSKIEEKLNGILCRLGLKLQRRHAMRDPVEIMIAKAVELGVETILDVGANKGQYAHDLRQRGWNGQIVSFEPTSDAYDLLVAACARDLKWTAARRAAIGSERGRAHINIAENLVSSSLLEINERSVQIEPGVRFKDKEEIDVIPLDDIINPEWIGPYAIKVDTQGFEIEVLKGAKNTLKNTKVIQLEASLYPVYKETPDIGEIFNLMSRLNFRAISIVEGFSDTAVNEMLQVDLTFVAN